LSNEQREQAARLKVMRQMVRSLIDSEDRKRSGMRWEDILGQSGSSGVHAKKAIEDLIDLKYVVRITESGADQRGGPHQDADRSVWDDVLRP
jgi:hypothetical protein